MALSTAVLQDELIRLLDSNASGFVGFGTSTADAAQKWSTAISQYAKSVIPFSTTSGAPAKAAFEAQFVLMNNQAANGFAQLTAAFSAYAAILATGMLPAYTGTPPPSPINLTPVIATGMAGGSGTDCANVLYPIIHAWFLTGTATPTAGGPPIVWS